jgi:phage terminase small subunit
MPRKSAASLSLVSLQGQPTRLQPPASLSTAERKAFVEIVTSSEATAFRESDKPLIVAYAQGIVLANQAAAQLQRHGAVIEGKASPWIPVFAQAMRAIGTMSMRLRLSPQSRAPNAPTRRAQVPMSVYDQMREGLLDE